MFTANDHQYMSLALQLAAQGLYSTSPNPRVGCLIVSNNKIVGQGAHLRAGEGHAEVIALQQAGSHAKGATAYVTLEPCSHYGRTPPCAEALIKSGVSKVIAAMVDPNPLVAGKGIALLQSHGVIVSSGLMQAQAQALNSGFVKRMSQKLPYVRAKIAATLDGKTALSNGQSQWITSSASRQDVQHWRAQSCAIMTGIGTVLADNPQLNVRLHVSSKRIRQPLRVIVDSQLKTPLEANVLNGGNALIAYVNDSLNHAKQLSDMGVTLVQTENKGNQVCLKNLLIELAKNQINDVLLESGERLCGAMLNAQLVDELLLYYAPKIMGGSARNMLDMPIFTQMNQVLDLDIVDIRQVGQDIRLQAKPLYQHVN